MDMVGGDYLERNLSVMNKRGRHVSIAFLKGSKVKEPFDFGRLLGNSLTMSVSKTHCCHWLRAPGFWPQSIFGMWRNMGC